MLNLLWNKPKPERFSLENLKLLCVQLKQFTGDANEENIISCLKELTQLLIWGDQHDPLLLEHFFEEKVHSHFLEILQSKHDGSLIVQVLQTLNIMFENVRSQESLYFLLSKNYVNDVIGLKYDFSNDEILAYYIYLLRTLSFKLSKDTIYFFFNEQLDDFPLYSEAIKFFNHEESMVRIAVRVITLNVYSVNDSQMQDFILDRTTKTYFSNLVWFIGDYGTTISDMLQHSGDGDHSRINYYLAEHMDCFYYVNDIIELEVPKINKILISSLLNRLMRPMYLDSLLPTGALVSKSNKSSTSGNLTSSTPPPTGKNVNGSTAMSRERSNDSTLSTHSTGTAGAWNISSPAPRNPSALSGSLFGAAGSAAAARMKTRTDSPLFEIDDDVESRETEELLASKDPESDMPSTSSTMGNPSRSMASSVPTSVTRPSLMIRGHSDDGDVFSKPKLNLSARKASKAPSILSPTLPTAMEEPVTKKQEDDHNMGQELRPVYTSARDRQIADIYPSTDEESEPDEEKGSGERTTKNLVQSSGTPPPPLPPRPQIEQELGQRHHEDETDAMHGSVCTQVGPTIQNREELIDRLMDIICGQPESGAHRFRIMTIQMATELLIEFVFTKGVVAGKEGSLQGNYSVAQQAAENQLGEERLQRLALAEEQFRERVRKGIRKMERKKRGESTNAPPLGILTGKVERSLTESKLGIDRQIVNIIAESSMIYGPEKDLDKEPDLDPDQDLMILFGLDPEYTSMKHGEMEAEDDKTLQDQQPTGIISAGSTVREGRSARIRSKIKAKMQGNSALSPSSSDPKPAEQTSRPPQSQLSSLQRLEAMVIRYIKWLHILIQCRQLLCRKAVTPAMALLGLHPQPIVATTSYFDNPGSLSGMVGSPTISITDSSDPRPPPLERRPSDLMSVGSSATVVSMHKGLQKAHATTATTTAMSTTPDAGSTGTGGNEDSRPISSLTSSPSTVADSVSNTTPPSVSSSLSSLSSSVLGAGSVSATLSQPASGTASGRIIGSRTLLSATAALEAAANTANHAHASGAGQGSGSSGTHHPFINDMLANHLDPLSASVSEAIRKSSAKIKKSVVDPLATNTNNLFKYSPMIAIAGHQQQEASATTSTSAPVKGFYRPPSAASSAASSVVSLVRPGSAGMRRSLSASSSSTSHSVSVAVPASTDGGYVGVKSAAGSSVGRNSEDHATLNDSSSPASRSKAVETDDDENFLSILDVGHPGHQMDDQVFRILETLGLAASK
ncbi:Protein CL16A [Mortierella sp. AD094]|nr:Protein CL16A [Mortierella sp. AD094]